MRKTVLLLALLGIACEDAGEGRKAVIPPEHAFGERGRGPVPGNATLILEIRVAEVQ